MNAPQDKFSIDGHKIHYHLDRVQQWQHGDKHGVFPIYVEISPVGHCNHRCTFCAVDYIGYKIRKLDTERLKPVLKDMAAHGVRSVMFAGEGEPLLHPDLAEIINWTHEQGIDVSITTNGVALTKKFVDACLRSVTWVKISCNAGTPQTYSQIHQTKEADWERVWENLTYACQHNNGATVGAQSLLLPENENEMITLAQKAKATGLDYVVIKPYSQHLRSVTHKYDGIRYEDFKKFDWIAGLSDEKFQVVCRDKTMEQHDAETRGYHKCYSTPYFWAYIMATGDVYGCSAYLLDERFRYGNINEQLFSQIWLGEKRKESMDYVEHELDISECRKNCRMDKVNRFLWDIKNPGAHKNFI